MKKIKHLGTSLLSLVLAFSMVFSALMLPDIIHINDTKEASAAGGISSTMGTNAYNGEVVGGATLTVGATYTFDGCEWRVAEAKDGGYVLVMTKGNPAKGVMSGHWAGYIKNNNNYYGSNVVGIDISSYYAGLKAVYDDIKATENTSASNGKGLYLVPYNKVSSQSGQYWEAFKTAAGNYSSFSASNNYAWTGTYNGNSNNAWIVNSNGNTNNGPSRSFNRR